jgi:hypothetical protein
MMYSPIKAFPSDYEIGKPFLYIYTYKGDFRIRVTNNEYTIDPEYWRSPRKRAFTRAESDEIGMDSTFLWKYYVTDRNYFHSRMGMNQNKSLTSSSMSEFIEGYLEDTNKLRKYRYEAARSLRHESRSELAKLRKRMRKALIDYICDH